MITTADYLAITNETAPPNFEVLRAAVIARLEAALGRRLLNASRTEWLTTYADGIAYPSALPVTSAGDLAHDAVSISTEVRGNGQPVEVTYVGGFTSYGSLEGPSLPYPLAAAIAWGVRTLAAEPTPPVPMGVQSMSVAGEFSVSVAPGTILGADGEPVPAQLVELADLGGRCATLASSYRRVL